MTTILVCIYVVPTASNDEKLTAVEEWDSILQISQKLNLVEQHELITELKNENSTFKIAQLLAQWMKWALETEEDVVDSSECHLSGSYDNNYKHNSTAEECSGTVEKQVVNIWGDDDTKNMIDGFEGVM